MKKYLQGIVILGVLFAWAMSSPMFRTAFRLLVPIGLIGMLCYAYWAYRILRQKEEKDV